MTSRQQSLVWLPLLAVVLGLVILVDTSVVVGMWVLAGLAFAGTVARGLGWAGTFLRVRRRVVDTSILATFTVLLVFLASSGVLS